VKKTVTISSIPIIVQAVMFILLADEVDEGMLIPLVDIDMLVGMDVVDAIDIELISMVTDTSYKWSN
jgi:hypothetical protein